MGLNMLRDPEDRLFSKHTIIAAGLSAIAPAILGVSIVMSALGGEKLSNAPFLIAFLFSAATLATMYTLARESSGRIRDNAASATRSSLRLQLLYGAAMGLIAGGIVIFAAVVAVFFLG